jgi:hypothetical protein
MKTTYLKKVWYGNKQTTRKNNSNNKKKEHNKLLRRTLMGNIFFSKHTFFAKTSDKTDLYVEEPVNVNYSFETTLHIYSCF